MTSTLFIKKKMTRHMHIHDSGDKIKMAASRPVLLHVVASFLVLYLSVRAESTSGTTSQAPIVTCKDGSVRGNTVEVTHGLSVHQFLGLPFGEPPTGKLRFAAPKPAKSWTGVREATKYGPSCPQNLVNMTFANASWESKELGRMEEDCLSLNVFVPGGTEKDSKKAVMVWIYGGGFSIGSTKYYNGTVLSALNDVIVVSINYRLGVFGFFNIPGSEVKGNYGIYDQILALKWIQENIAQFGGDPGRVTIFGESAGGISASLLLLSPLTTGLFQRAIAQSGSAASPFCCHRVRNTNTVQSFAATANCSMDAQLMDCLRSRSMEELLKAQYNYAMFGKLVGPFDIGGPVFDAEFLPDMPRQLLSEGRFVKRDVMIGFTSDEMGTVPLFVDPGGSINGTPRHIFENYVVNMTTLTHNDNLLIKDAAIFQYTDHSDLDSKLKTRKALGDIGTDSMFHAPAIFEADALSRAGINPFVYVFSHHPKFSLMPNWTGALHGDDLFFMFGEPVVKMQLLDAFPFVTGFTEIEKGLSTFVMKMWANFAKFGNPNQREDGHDLVTWPKFTSSEQAYLNIGLEPSVKYKLHPERMAFWNDFIPKLMDKKPETELQEGKLGGKDEL